MYVRDWCYKCRLYDRKFFRKQSLVIHIRLHNNVSVKINVLCVMCTFLLNLSPFSMA